MLAKEMSASYRSLITHCMKAISTYDANKTGPDSHIETYLASSDLTTVSHGSCGTIYHAVYVAVDRFRTYFYI